MANNTNFPSISSRLPELMNFISTLAQGYQAGEINSWEIMEEKIREFLSPNELEKVFAVAPHWRIMASYAEGDTEVHTISALVALILGPEFQQATQPQQELLKWTVLLHDIAKESHEGKRDFLHAFHSAAVAAETLHSAGFPATPEYDNHIKSWVTLINTAIIKLDGISGYIQDNEKLPEIYIGIEKLFGHNTPAALIIKTILLHASINTLEEWPQAAPLNQSKIKQCVDSDLIPFLKVMTLVDSDAYSLFYEPTKKQFRQETLDAFTKLEALVTA